MVECAVSGRLPPNAIVIEGTQRILILVKSGEGCKRIK